MKKILENCKTLLKNIINFALIYFYLKLMDWIKWLLPNGWIKLNDYITIIIYIFIVIKLISLIGIKINIKFIKETKKEEIEKTE